MDAVDTTGAGDAFVAGILSQLAVDLSILQVSKMYINHPKSLHHTTAETHVVRNIYYCLNY